MWQKPHWRNKKAIGCKTQGTQAKFIRVIWQDPLVQYAFGENHHIVWKEAKSLETETN
jgi:hypothetical protein